MVETMLGKQNGPLCPWATWQCSRRGCYFGAAIIPGCIENGCRHEVWSSGDLQKVRARWEVGLRLAGTPHERGKQAQIKHRKYSFFHYLVRNITRFISEQEIVAWIRGKVYFKKIIYKNQPLEVCHKSCFYREIIIYYLLDFCATHITNTATLSSLQLQYNKLKSAKYN